MGRPRNSVERMLRINVVQEPGGCWAWIGKRGANGYPHVTIASHHFLAHRVFFEHFRGAIPEGFQVDHLCKNPQCVNPDHLEAVTGKENNARSDSPSGINGRKEVCVHGHPLSGANLYVTPNGRRQCRACRAVADQKRKGVSLA